MTGENRNSDREEAASQDCSEDRISGRVSDQNQPPPQEPYGVDLPVNPSGLTSSPPSAPSTLAHHTKSTEEGKGESAPRGGNAIIWETRMKKNGTKRTYRLRRLDSGLLSVERRLGSGDSWVTLRSSWKNIVEASEALASMVIELRGMVG